MEEKPIARISQEELDKFEEGHKKFMSVLTEEEIKVLTHIHLFYSGYKEHKLPNQDEIEKVAKEKLRNTGLDADNYGQYIEVTKKL